MRRSKLDIFLEQTSGQPRALTRDEKQTYDRKWLETFARRVKKQTGQWVYNGYMWHTFSFEFVKARSGAEAIQLYEGEKSTKYLILSDQDRHPSYLCDGMELIGAEVFDDDYYVVPFDYEWTMAFTHEQPELGPYFVRKSWLK